MGGWAWTEPLTKKAVGREATEEGGMTWFRGRVLLQVCLQVRSWSCSDKGTYVLPTDTAMRGPLVGTSGTALFSATSTKLVPLDPKLSGDPTPAGRQLSRGQRGNLMGPEHSYGNILGCPCAQP